ncbi:hypothetical protein [Bacillus anthracis]|uniref:hypothetical protein n=1 Tax=Bacillus anthracis TaxID=1392 RepID=UPI0008FE46EC|nr:hypothetical protein [Bacillus anthracis]AXO97144.1 hypothetical protein DY470_05215 [Bacillus anthracis]OJD84780.1 hypothetical protein A9486_23005 [Bacillus anthracis]
MVDIFSDVGEWCDICGEEIKPFEVSTMYIEGCEKVLCKTCNSDMQQKVKVIDFRVLKDVLTQLTIRFGREKVRKFHLAAAETLIKENNISLSVEKCGGKFNQEKLGEFISLSTQELLTLITFLKGKIDSHLWMNAVIGNILERQITVTLSPITN